jgi:N-methylhydantoinase A
MIAAFHDAYHARYGNRFETIPVESVTYRVQLVARAPKVRYPLLGVRDGTPPRPGRVIELSCLDAAREYEREQLLRGDAIAGPAIIREPMSTTHVVAGQRATVGRYGELIVERTP